MAMKKIARREFLKLAGITSGAAILGACTPQPQVITQVVKETQIVEQTKIVEKEVQKEVEKIVEVTPTPPPAVLTPQGREMPADAAPLDKQVFYAAGTEPKFLDTARDIYSSGATNLGDEPLLRNNENIELVPALAESWKPGPNAEYWDFTIRKEALWSDGQPITADDVVYTYWHLSNPALANPWVWFYFDIKGVQKVASGQGTKEDLGVEKIDDHTVRIWGEYGPIPYLPALVSYQGAAITPKHVAEKDPEHWGDSIETFVSGGPYIPVQWDHNKQLVWEINPNYKGPHKPAIQKVVNVIFAAGANQFNAWLNKEVDLLHVLDQAQLAAARSDPKLNALLHFFNNFQSSYMAFNTNMPPLDKKEVRQALAHAIDRDTLTQQVLNGTAVSGYSMLPPGFPAYNPDLKANQVYDVELAKKLLADGGITDPASVTLEVFTNGRDVAVEFVKQQWETNLGVKVNLTQLEPGVWGERRANHDMMIFRGQYEYDFVDPSNMLTSLWRSVPAPAGKSEPWGSPRHAWKNEEFDKLLTAAGSEVDVQKRIKMFQDAEQILTSEAAAAFLYHQVVFQIWWPWLVGMHPDKNGNVVFRWLDISRFQMYIHKDVDQLKAQY